MFRLKDGTPAASKRLDVFRPVLTSVIPMTQHEPEYSEQPEPDDDVLGSIGRTPEEGDTRRITSSGTARIKPDDTTLEMPALPTPDGPQDPEP